MHHSNIGALLGPFDYVGENIATGSRGVSAGALHVAWMHSQEHRDNILSPGFQSVGIGVYCSPNGSIWATTEFGRPSSAGQPPAYNGGTPANPIAAHRRRLRQLLTGSPSASGVSGRENSSSTAPAATTEHTITSVSFRGGIASANQSRTPGTSNAPAKPPAMAATSTTRAGVNGRARITSTHRPTPSRAMVAAVRDSVSDTPSTSRANA